MFIFFVLGKLNNNTHFSEELEPIFAYDHFILFF